MAITSLVERSAELKRELLEFSWQPRFDRDRRNVLKDYFPDGIVGDESDWILRLFRAGVPVSGEPVFRWGVSHRGVFD